jgi:hypothetical protein
MNANAHAHARMVGPLSREKGVLQLDSRGDCICRALKHYEKGVSLCIDLVAVSSLKCCAQQAAALFQNAGIAITELL